MNRVFIMALAISATACTTDTRNITGDRSQFDVVREGVNLDERALICANNPQSVGFETSQECFADAQEMLERNP